MANPKDESSGPVATPGPRSFRLVPVSRAMPLPDDLRRAWQAALLTQRATGGHGSPFLGPTLTATLAQERDDIQLAVGYEAGIARSFLPCHVKRGHGEPIGGRFCDVHGPVGVADAAGFRELLVGAGLKSWSFQRCPEASVFEPKQIWSETKARFVRTDQGVEGLRSGGLLESTSQLKQALRKERKLAREVGPLRFEFNHQGPEVLSELIRWKSAQRLRTNSPDVLRHPWAVAALEKLRMLDEPDGAGALSVLWAGDHVVAAHYGFADDELMHWWIPSYAPEFSAHSPGLSLLLHLIRECHSRGIAAIDLGHGEERYKTGFATGTSTLYRGSVDRSALRLAVGSSKARIRDAVRESSLEPTWIATKRLVRRVRAAVRPS